MQAAAFGNQQRVLKLFGEGVGMDTFDCRYGRTALHRAAVNNTNAMAELSLPEQYTR